ncbi:uncharacterized protein [Parasteatoda tepidariorum]|uniref:uncharacterized protein isoform X2 n=1 Tax=Parasteatoda tepidariorum TaxID=114398 RepID=UPI001C71FCE3|nr:serine/threonine-protein kinase Nek2 isoform X2 [Parasteatoda tepidariorum]
MIACQTTTMDTSYNEPVISKYRKVALLGNGSYGTCYLVKQNKTSYVLKEVNMNSLTSVEKQRAFNEVSMLATLKHRHIIGYRDSAIDHTSGKLSIIMDYADSGDLAAAIEKQKGVPFSEYQTISWFIQISQALQYIHSLNILHRDLKTQNIFLSGNHTIKIGDFGVSRLLNDSKDFAKTAIGTPYYLSPEIIMRKPYNTKSDMWALGCVLFEISALERPFKAVSLPQLVSVILEGSRQPFPTWMKSGLINQLVDDLLSLNPDQRPSTDEILANPSLRSILSGFVQSTNEIPSRHVTRMAYSSNPKDSVKRSASVLNSNNSKIPKCSVKTAENERKPTATRVIPPAVVVTEYQDKYEESDRKQRSSSTRAVSLAAIVPEYRGKYAESDRKQRSFSTRAVSPATFVTENRNQFEANERKPRSTSIRATPPGIIGDETTLNENDRKSTSTRVIPSAVVVTEYQDKYEESYNRQRSFSTLADSPVAIATEYQDKYEESYRRQRSFSSRAVSPATFVTEPRDKFETNQRKSRSASIQATPPGIIATENKMLCEFEANEPKPRSAAIRGTSSGIVVNENQITDKFEEKEMKKKWEKRFVFQRTTVANTIANKTPNKFPISEPGISSKSKMNITYVVKEESNSVENTKPNKLDSPLSVHEIDFGYSSEEADSTDKDKGVFELSPNNSEQFHEGMKHPEAKTAHDSILSNQTHCDHSQCNQCLLDMMWKNRIRGCVDLSNSNGDYLRLKTKLLLIFGHDLFQKIYESLLHEWERNESNFTQTSIQSFAKLLNYEQVQHLPLMMQLIQLDLVKLSEKET